MSDIILQDKSEDLITVNYWKEVHKEFSDILKDLSGIVLLTHNSIEVSDILDILDKVKADRCTTVLYISLSRSYECLNLVLQGKKFVNKRFAFIDCTRRGTPAPDGKECLCQVPPTRLSDLKQAIFLGIQRYGPDIVVVDSLSNFIDLSQPNEFVIHDFHKFLSTIKTSSLSVVQDTFILLYDSGSKVMKSLPKYFFTNLILKVEIVRDTSQWID